MKRYFGTKLGELYHGDYLKVMRKMESDSIDLLVTDPPYGYSFMGKDWDKVVIGVEKWAECLRVLKPGAFAFIMSAPRQNVLSRMIINLQDAGFNTGFTSMYWTYATGFPKAGNISKLVDKRLGVKREIIGKSKRQIAKIPVATEYQGTQTFAETAVGREASKWITAPATDEAKALDGSYAGFQPKPAVEIIIVAMKPLSEKTYVDQAMKNGHGITWLDGCRVPYERNCRLEKGGSYQGNRTGSNKESLYQSGNEEIDYDYELPQGRFPANLLVSDDVLNDGKILKSGFKEGGRYKGGTNQCAAGEIDGISCYNDSGSFSRYFDLDKWWIERVKELPESVQKTFPFLLVPKASKSEKNKGCEGLEKKYAAAINRRRKNCGHGELDGRRTGACCDNPDYINEAVRKEYRNNHPTVKPLKLFSYLITLGSRIEDVIMDPFLGSGTVAVMSEGMGREYIGIEIEKDYCDIAIQRIKSVQ